MGGKVVPEHGGIFQVGLGVPLLGMDEDGELGRIPHEKDGSVVEHPVPVALFGVELEGKPTRVTSTVGGALFATDCRETSKHLGFLADSLEHVRNGKITDVICDLEFTIGASTLGMHNTFGDPLAVEMRQQIDQVEVLEQERTVTTDPLGRLGVHDRTAIGGGVCRGFIVAVGA